MLRILVVGGENSSESISKVLSEFGHSVEVVGYDSPSLAPDLVHEQDVILLDLGNPGRGRDEEAAKNIKSNQDTKRTKTPFIIALSRPEAGIVSTPNSNFDLHLTKPLVPKVLEKLLERLQSFIYPDLLDNSTPMERGFSVKPVPF
jgi:CheY-like chemotaxis protein